MRRRHNAAEGKRNGPGERVHREEGGRHAERLVSGGRFRPGQVDRHRAADEDREREDSRGKHAHGHGQDQDFRFLFWNKRRDFFVFSNFFGQILINLAVLCV